MDPNRKITKKFTKKFDSKVINRQYFHRKTKLDSEKQQNRKNYFCEKQSGIPKLNLSSILVPHFALLLICQTGVLHKMIFFILMRDFGKTIIMQFSRLAAPRTTDAR